MNKEGLELLKQFEGFRNKAYLDPVGIPTIGYGFTKGVKMGQVMSREAADKRLAQEVAEFEKGVKSAISTATNDNQLSAMVSLAYNIGIGAFKKSSVLRRHNQCDFLGAADAFSMWVKAGGKTLPGLVRRRNAEAALYLKPTMDIISDKQIAEVGTQRAEAAGSIKAQGLLQTANLVQAGTAAGAIGLGTMDRYVAIVLIVVVAVAAYVIYRERRKISDDDGI